MIKIKIVIKITKEQEAKHEVQKTVYTSADRISYH